jgi:hypothetical protein
MSKKIEKRFPKGSPEWFGQQGGKKGGKKGGQAWARKLKKLQQVAEKAKVADTCWEHEAPEKDDIEIVSSNFD